MKSPTAKARVDPPPATTPTEGVDVTLSPEFIAAREKWRELRLQMRKFNERREQLQVGLNYAGLAIGNEPELVRRLINAFDQDLLTAIRRNPRKIHSELESLTDQIIELQPTYAAENEAYEAARRAESGRIAKLFLDRHRKAVLGLAAVLEELNRAVEMERTVRRDFARVSPEPTSAALPDWSGDFDDLDLLTWHSTGATWARRVRAAGFAS